MKWLAEVRRSGGGEGVVGSFATRDEEKYDPKKVNFPTRPSTPKETP